MAADWWLAPSLPVFFFKVLFSPGITLADLLNPTLLVIQNHLLSELCDNGFWQRYDFFFSTPVVRPLCQLSLVCPRLTSSVSAHNENKNPKEEAAAAGNKFQHFNKRCICPSSVHLFVHPSFQPSICPSVHHSIQPFFHHLSIHSTIHPSSYLVVRHLSIHLLSISHPSSSIQPAICPCVHPSVRPSSSIHPSVPQPIILSILSSSSFYPCISLISSIHVVVYHLFINL